MNQSFSNIKSSSILDNFIEKGNKIKNGKADKLSIEDIAKKHKVSTEYLKKQIKAGIKIEREHTDDDSIAEEIAMDHLTESSEYYIKLKKMEKTLEKGYVEGIYSDTPQNRKLNRVGVRYTTTEPTTKKDEITEQHFTNSSIIGKSVVLKVEGEENKPWKVSHTKNDVVTLENLDKKQLYLKKHQLITNYKFFFPPKVKKPILISTKDIVKLHNGMEAIITGYNSHQSIQVVLNPQDVRTQVDILNNTTTITINDIAELVRKGNFTVKTDENNEKIVSTIPYSLSKEAFENKKQEFEQLKIQLSNLPQSATRDHYLSILNIKYNDYVGGKDITALHPNFVEKVHKLTVDNNSKTLKEKQQRVDQIKTGQERLKNKFNQNEQDLLFTIISDFDEKKTYNYRNINTVFLKKYSENFEGHELFSTVYSKLKQLEIKEGKEYNTPDNI